MHHRFLRVTIAIWILSCVVVVVVTQLKLSHRCLAPVASGLSDDGYFEELNDFRTGISLLGEGRVFNSIQSSVSPDGNHRLYFSTQGADNIIYIGSSHKDTYTQFYVTRFRLSFYWSADSQAVFIYEYNGGTENENPHRLFSMNIKTHDIEFDLNTDGRVVNWSPDYRYLYLLFQRADSEGRQMASVDTITGNMHRFNLTFTQNRVTWSDDYRWGAVQMRMDLYIIDAETGAFHPQLNEVFEGLYPVWTEHSLWFMRSDINNSSIWRVSLDDGSMQMEEENARLRAISRDDRWMVYSRHEIGYGVHYYLYDRVNETLYPDLNIQSAFFSDDSSCLIIKSATNQPALTGEITIYDLETMDTLFNQGGALLSYNYGWYGEK